MLFNHLPLPPFWRHLLFIGLAAFTAVNAQAQSPAPATAVPTSTLERLQTTKTITLGVRNSAAPFASINAQGQAAGFTWDLCKAVVNALSETLQSPLEIKVVPVSLEESFTMLRDSKIDMQCGSTTHTQERAQRVNFSYSLFISGIAVAYRTEDAQYANPDKYGRIGALKGSTAAKIATIRAKRDNAATVVPLESYEQGIEWLKAGKIDTFAADGQLIPQDSEISVRRQQLTVEPYALMLPKDDEAFSKAVDSVLAAIMRGPLMDKLAKQHKLRVNFMTRDIWVHPDRTPAPPQF
ncbi:transporter substrate-binding domain-containing protein [Ottowia sp.]|uniref:transporter substrate-binding domain-containing protein n=1 Tax=Ottowia sp. TaxID=1898956 RepID=UPI003A8A89CE